MRDFVKMVSQSVLTFEAVSLTLAELPILFVESFKLGALQLETGIVLAELGR